MHFDRINPILMETSKTSDSSISKFANNVLFDKNLMKEIFNFISF